MFSFRNYIQTAKYLFNVVMQSRADDDLSRTFISLHNDIAYLKDAAAPSKESYVPFSFWDIKFWKSTNTSNTPCQTSHWTIYFNPIVHLIKINPINEMRKTWFKRSKAKLIWLNGVSGRAFFNDYVPNRFQALNKYFHLK